MTPFSWLVVIIVAVVFFFPDRIPKLIRGFRGMISGYKDTTGDGEPKEKSAKSQDRSED